ncbi:kinesin-like protein KIF21A [Pyxicephalus adspersus]|uniref:kinesin-like protein KIF21A n=1 Tax=Pyxicephalus adspersus TaxID=30357 RepID=UPI003B5A323C
MLVSLKVELRRHVEELLSRNLKVEPKDAGTKAKEQRSLQPTSVPEPPVKEQNVPKTAPKVKSAQPASKIKPKGQDPSPLQDSRFLVHSLEGHSDLVTAVLIHDTYIISGSWDTSVRVWDISTGSELKTLCGHTEAVTCLTLVSPREKKLNSSLLPPHEHFVSSGSADSSIKVWSLITGQPLLSIYTFSAVSAIVYIPDTSLIISGSDGGKIDVWDLETQENLRSQRSHEEKVTALQFHAGLLYSGSLDGYLKVWKISPSGSLSLLHSCDSLSLPLRGLFALCAAADRIYVANQGASLKVVDWKQDNLVRLSNHTSGSGFVDALAVTPDNLLVASGFNLDQGHGFLNVRDIKTGQYLSTLSHPDISRLLCLAVCRTPDGLCRWVTGGRELLMWEELPKKAAVDSSAIQVQFCADFLHPAPESDSEEDEEEDLWESDDESPPSNEPSQTSSWRWCLLM